jgi:hypothetical protein
MPAVIHYGINLSWFLLSIYMAVKMYTTVMLLTILYGCGTWSVTVRMRHRLMVLRKLFGAARRGNVGAVGTSIMRSGMIGYAHSV